MTTEVLSTNIFNKIRSKFGDIQLGDSEGNVTADPKTATFYDFEYTEDSDTFGRMSISLADGESMKVYYNKNLTDKIDEDSKSEFFSFLKELKDLAVQHGLKFDVRDITKSNLSNQDFKNLADTNQTVNSDSMSEEVKNITKLAGISEVSDMGMNKYGLAAKHMDGKFYSYKNGAKTGGPFDSKEELAKHQQEILQQMDKSHNQESVSEGLTGTAKRSYENLDKTRLIIRHTGKVDETVPGARSRQIQSLYIENEDGERFKYPMTHLAGARAMTRHVANGGRPHDDFGQHIIQTSEDIAKLNSFSRYVSHKDQLNDNASDIIDQTKLKLENLRTYMKGLTKQSNYKEAFDNFKSVEQRMLDDETRNSYREKFTLKTLDDRVEEALPLIHNIMSEYKTDDEPTDKDAKIEPPVDHGAIVQSFLTDPDNKLVLRKDDSADKMLSVTKFKDKNTMLGSILSDIAARMLTKTGEEDRVANFASRVADKLEQEGTPFFKPDADYMKNKKIAVMLAKRYIDDYKKMKSDPAYADEVRVDPANYNPKKDRQGKAKEDTAEFESWVNNIDQPAVEDKGSTLASRIIRKAGEEDRDSMDSEMFIKSADMLDAGELDELGKFLYNSDTAPREFVMAKIANHDPDTFKQMYGDQEGYFSTMKPKGMEGVTFEDIKPYVSMYKDDNGKMVNDVLDKDGNSVYKTHDAKAAMAFLSKNFAKMRSGEMKGEPKKEDSLDESRAKIVESLKAKVEKDTARADEELSRIVQLTK